MGTENLKTKALFQGNKKTIKIFQQGEKFGITIKPDNGFFVKKEYPSYEKAKEEFEKLTKNENND